MSRVPFVSVVMPVRNEARFIERSLGAVLQQNYPHSCMEVIVADGLSTDATRAAIERAAKAHRDVPVVIVDNPGRIVPTGFNQAIVRAHGEIIVRVDGHTIIAPDYVRECVDALRRSGADNVGGRMDPVSEKVFGRATALVTQSRFGVGGARFHYSDREEWVDTVYMGAWPAAVFRRIGLFDEEQVRNQDDEFNYRLLEHGGKILLSPRIKSSYHNRSTLGSLWRQYFQYGYWKVRVMQKHPRQMRIRHFIPPLFAGALLVSLAATPFSAAAAWLFVATASSYTVANTTASILTARARKVDRAMLLPLAFAAIHTAYGFGFLYGLTRFWNRWGDRHTRSSCYALAADAAWTNDVQDVVTVAFGGFPQRPTE